MEEKLKKLSSTIINYSLKVKEYDRVLIICHTDKPKPLVMCLINHIVENKGVPFVRMIDSEIDAYLLENTLDNRLESLAKADKYDVDNYDCFISIRYITNDYENKNVPKDVLTKIGEATKDSREIRVNQRRWVLLNYPSHLDAYKAGMKNKEFFDYAVDVMNINYQEMKEKIKPLKELMEKTDMVRIISPGTNITFSIKGIPAIPCCGEMNIPDGEVYTAPVKDSINGVITFNTPSPYDGYVYNNVKLTYENGRLIKAECDMNEEGLHEIFTTDEGSKYVGEFSFGLNPKILHPMGDILYDEKIIGSIHFTPGSSYDDAFNGNRSSIHWDLVLIQRKEYGGGEIYFDHTLIRKDGLFILPELQHLNYNLK